MRSDQLECPRDRHSLPRHDQMSAVVEAAPTSACISRDTSPIFQRRSHRRGITKRLHPVHWPMRCYRKFCRTDARVHSFILSKARQAMDDLDYCQDATRRVQTAPLPGHSRKADRAIQRPIGAVRAEAATTTLERDLRRIARQLEDQWPTFRKLDRVRQRVLLHMAFNIGVARLLAQRGLLRAVELCHWNLAADEMFMSDWAAQDEGQRWSSRR